MGTRHLIGVVKDGVLKVAQYGQWDGYPEGQGVNVLAFLRTADLTAFAEKVAAARFFAPGELGNLGKRLGKNWEQSEYGYISRDTGAEILDVVMERPAGIVLKDSSRFAADSLFCEFAYVVDLDRGVLEVYRGFQHKPHESGRFASMPPEKPDEKGPREYYPVALVKEFPLASLPTDEQFCEQLSEKEVEA